MKMYKTKASKMRNEKLSVFDMYLHNLSSYLLFPSSGQSTYFYFSLRLPFFLYGDCQM